MIKIALTGKVRSGKDTIAEYAKEKYGMVIFSFGYDLKEEFHKKFPHIKRDPKPVRGYQLFGQLMREVKGEDVWVDKCFERIRGLEEIAKNYNTTGENIPFMPIIKDLRQPNELERCREEGFYIVRVNCPDHIRMERMKKKGDNASKEDLNFETEKYLDNFYVDYEVDNVGSLEELYHKFDVVMKDIRKREGMHL